MIEDGRGIRAILMSWSPKRLFFSVLTIRPDPMRPARSPAFDHGAALRTPPAHDQRSWAKLWAWLDERGRALDEPGTVSVQTPDGWTTARPGDWIVLTVGGRFYVAAAKSADRD
jgi:hypothetical protein